MAKIYLMIAALSGFFAVALGAFGAHGLKARLSDDMMLIYQTAVQYHFYHTFALLGAALLLLYYPQAGAFKWSAGFMVAGVLVFSGSLYLLTFTGLRWLGAVTPFGGLAFLAGWAVMAVGVYQHMGR